MKNIISCRKLEDWNLNFPKLFEIFSSEQVYMYAFVCAVADLLLLLLFINCNWAYARWQCLQKGYTVNKEHSTPVSRKDDVKP
jgi:hypothetical protein